jgi:hypothetical protein
MRNVKTKIKFTDIAGMLDRDEMREIIGGCGVSGGSGIEIFGGGGGSFTGFGPVVYNSPVSSVGSFQSAGFVGYNSPSPSAGSINIQTGSSSSSSAGSSSSSSAGSSSGSYGGFSSWGAFGTSGSTYGGSGSNVYTGGGGGGISVLGSSPTTINPSPDFLASPFGAIYKNLVSNNNNFLCLLDKFNSSKTFNLTYIYDSMAMPKGWDAQTYGTTNLNTDDKIIGANLYMQFDPVKIIIVNTIGNVTTTYERTELGKALDIIHEALHAYMIVNNIAAGKDHTAFNDYRNLMINTLSEYNTDNNLGFTSQQINELAFKGTTGSNLVPASEQFCSYIENLATANNTSYSTELQAFNIRMSNLNWNLVSTVTKP